MSLMPPPVCVYYERFKAKSGVQRGKPEGTQKDEIRIAMLQCRIRQRRSPQDSN